MGSPTIGQHVSLASTKKEKRQSNLSLSLFPPFCLSCTMEKNAYHTRRGMPLVFLLESKVNKFFEIFIKTLNAEK